MAYYKSKKPRPVQTEEQKLEEIRRTRMPKRDELEMFGVVSQRVGGTQILVMCEDGKERNCRITGKMRKRIWMRMNDIVIVKLWDFQPSKADVAWRYTPTQADHLKRKGYLSKLPV